MNLPLAGDLRLWPHTHTGYCQLLNCHTEEVSAIGSIFDLSTEIALKEVRLADLSPGLTDHLRQPFALGIDRISHACNATPPTSELVVPATGHNAVYCLSWFLQLQWYFVSRSTGRAYCTPLTPEMSLRLL
jgi:hypothetical protein